MLKRITKKKHLLLTAAVLAAMTIPVQAAEKKPDAGKEIKTGAVVVTASRQNPCDRRCSSPSASIQRRRVWWEIKFPFAAHRQIKH